MECVYEKNVVEIYRATPNVYFRKSDLGKRGQCNGAFLVSGSAVGIVDVPTVEAAEEMIDEAKFLFQQPIRYVFLTHGHPDHIIGLPFFYDKDVTIFCSKRLLDKLALKQGECLATFVAVEGSMTIMMSGFEIELFTMPDITHSPWDMFIRMPKEHYLCGGDNLVKLSAIFCNDADMETWPRMLRKLYLEGDKYILPGHGDIFPAEFILEMADNVELVSRIGKNCLTKLKKSDFDTISAGKIISLAESFLASDEPDAALLCQKAGDSALRIVRTIMWYYLPRNIH